MHKIYLLCSLNLISQISAMQEPKKVTFAEEQEIDNWQWGDDQDNNNNNTIKTKQLSLEEQCRKIILLRLIQNPTLDQLHTLDLSAESKKEIILKREGISKQ